MMKSKVIRPFYLAIFVFIATGCASQGSPLLPDLPALKTTEYIVGPGDQLQIFVWRNPDLSSDVVVRPDGRISSPLIIDLEVSGLTALDITRLVEKRLGAYIRTPQVSVIISGFNSTVNQQIRVIGKATNPRTIPFRAGMTLLDVMIDVQGLSEFADGDNAQLVRTEQGVEKQYTIELDSLIREGDISKNRAVYPGDTIIIPESWF